MSPLSELLARVKELDEALAGEIPRRVLARHESDIMELQRYQLFQGRASSGEDIRPYYSEDVQPRGYFSSVQAAERYAHWKNTGFTYPMLAERNPDAPNLYINGYFHENLGPRFGPDSVTIQAKNLFARDVVNKYGLDTFGLTAENWAEIFRERGAADEILEEMRDILKK